MNTKSLVRLTAAASLTAGLAIALTAPAQADPGTFVKSGSCTMTSTWTLSARPDAGQIEVDALVHSNVMGQNWVYNITKTRPVANSGPTTTSNGYREVVARGMISTTATGSFDLRVLTPDRLGVEKISFQATNPETNEVCSASLTI